MQIYVDESKAKAYLIVAVIVAPGQAAGFRKRMIGLRMPRQGHIHFVNERDSRRKMILDELVDMGISARVYSISGLNPIAARPQLLGALMNDLRELRASKIIFERDDSAQKADAIAWSYARGGDFRRRSQSLIESVTELTL